MRKICSMIIAYFFVCGLLAGCGGSNKISPPFSVEERTGYTAEEAISLFEDAGFTNISTETVSTISSSKIGKVDMVMIDGNYTFGKYSSFAPDVPVVISYYVELERTAPQDENPDQRYADRLDYTLEQYASMKAALIACGVTENNVKAVARIGSHEACLVLGNYSFTINFNNDYECVQICNADAVFYEAGEVLLLISEYIK